LGIEREGKLCVV